MAKDHISLAWKNVAAYWKKNTWPARPGAGDLVFYRQAFEEKLKVKEKINVLVLGSTPELRDLAGEYAGRVYLVCADINLEMYLAMNSLLSRKIPGEVFILSDWATLPLADNFFDLIMGDGVFSNSPDLDKFLRRVSELLNKDGIFVTRFSVAPEKIIKLPADELLDLFIEYNDEKAEGVLFMTLHFNAESRSMAAARKYLEKYFDPQQDKYVHPAKKVARLLNGPFLGKMLKDDKEWGIMAEKGYRELMEKYFQIISRQQNPDLKSAPYFSLYEEFVIPVFSLKKK
ncbi:MAG: class I SAM-dependent methyltransferase [Patescibacteria group bacterium]|nr:class I SAM-dependent methyltransferase [Patescibacteria group bacterium]